MSLLSAQDALAEIRNLVEGINMMAPSLSRTEANALSTICLITMAKIGDLNDLLDEWRAAVEGGQEPSPFKEAAE
jgi:hypothetical protein